MRAVELDYELPQALIAQVPAVERDGARLLCLDPTPGGLQHRAVIDLPSLVPPALWVVNDTRVIPARLFGRKASGGKVELLLVEPLDGDPASARWWSMARGSRSLRPGLQLRFAADFTAVVRGPGPERLWELELHADDVAQALERHGQVPLPPYIEREPERFDQARYQTVFAEHGGAVAAPTAGLHLSETLLQRLADRGHELARVTLHVGPGTFVPLRSERLAEHQMHAERYHVPEATAVAIARARSDGRPVLAVGTTVVRTLEAAALPGGMVAPGAGRTALFIYPPYAFEVVDVLLTNFHLPRSTLLALVMAFGGEERVRAAYEEAVREEYRFFSYGDAMLIRGRG